MQGNLTVLGIKQFKGTVEGLAFDHTKLLVSLPFPRARAESNLGFDVIEVPYGKSDNFEQFKGKKFPLTIDADYEVTTKGLEVFELKILLAPAIPKVNV
jgi:hypothetical protein